MSGSGLKPPGLTAWLTQLRWRRRKRIDAPSPTDDETRRSLVLGTAPGMPTKIGRRVPRSQTRSTQSESDARVEADLADDVRGETGLVEHRLNGGLVVDERVALGVARDPDVLEAVPELGDRLQERSCAGVLACRLVRVPRHDEHVVRVDLVDPVDDLREMHAVAHEPSREMGDDGVAVLRQSLREVERVLDALPR